MFLGRYEHTLNKQGRTSVPARFRDLLEERGEAALIITNHEACLVAYPSADWHALMDKLATLPSSGREVTEFMRFFVSGAQECPIDKQGRVLIPPTLREHAGLTDQIMIVGMVKKIEIWAKPRWESAFSAALSRFAENSQALAELGF